MSRIKEIFFITILLCTFIPPSHLLAENQSTTPQPHNSQFVLTKDKIEFWKDLNDDGIRIEITESASIELSKLTKNLINQPLHLYIEDYLAMSPTVREPIGGKGLMLHIGADQKKEILKRLPEQKEP